MEWRGRWTTLLAADVHETRATTPAVQLRHVGPAGRHRRDGVTQRAPHVRRTLRGGGGEAKTHEEREIERERERQRERETERGEGVRERGARAK